MERNQIPKHLLSGQLRDEQRRTIIVQQKDDPARSDPWESVKIVLFIISVILTAAWLEGF